MSAEQGGEGARRGGAEGAGVQGAVDRWAIALLLAMMVLVSTVISVTRVSDFAGTPKALSLRESLAWDLTSTAAWTALLPAMLWLANRFTLPDPRPWRSVTVHAVATGPFSLAHVLLMGALRWALYAVVGSRYDPAWPIENAFYEYRKDVLTYGAILIFLWSWRALRRPPGPAAPAIGVEPQPLEVRDGARRLYIRPQDIAWAAAAGNYVALHLADREVLMRAPLSSLEARLEAAGFVRIHRSRLVNRAQIASLAATPAGDFTVTLRDGRVVAGSRRYRQAISTPTAA